MSRRATKHRTYRQRKSEHWTLERKERERVINDVIGIGRNVKSFYQDKGHENGPEDHIVTSTGIIKIYNHASRVLVTMLIARPGQIRKYWEGIGQNTPKYLMDIALEHQKRGYNLL